MHTFSSTMPRLFGRSQTPTPAQIQGQAQAQPLTEVQPQSTQAPRAKLVRRTGGGHFPSSPSSSFGRPGPPGPAEFHREGSLASASASAYEVLLNGPDRSSLYGSIGGGSQNQDSQQQHQHRYYAVRSQRNLHRAWLAAADARRPSWSGERPPPRKLVKDPGGSARPSASREILDEGDLRRKAAGESETGNGNGNGNGNDKSTSGGPGALGIRRKMARWRDMRW